MTGARKSALAALASSNGGVVKVCGITNAADAEIAIELGADLIGLVLWDGSPRSVEVDVAAEIVASLEGRCPTVAVFGDVLAPEAEAVVRMVGFDWVQLCGESNPVYFHNFPVPILRRVSASDEGADEMKRWAQFADGFVLENAESIGGSGKAADWEAAKELAQGAPCLLAGGLAADNVAEGVAKVRPLGVDASSRLESEPRYKSEQAVEAFVAAARQALSEESP
jgi:phosphoribosylanthranilate isomerase